MIAIAEHQKPLVLIVEDDELVRFASIQELAANGFRTMEARTADEALAILDQCSSIDALFTDIAMPGSMNGLALARLVGCERPGIYVLITSGDTLSEESPIPAGSDFVQKPYAMMRVAHMIRTHVSGDRKLSS
jgi:two-component system, response regulator PdtaR